MAGILLTTALNRGTHANRPAAAQANAGYRYTETDTGREYQSDGTNWNLIGVVGATQTLTDGATINWDLSLGANAAVTLGGNRTLAAPTNLTTGFFSLRVIQDATGGRTLAWNAVFKWPGGAAPTLTATASGSDLFLLYCDGTNLYDVTPRYPILQTLTDGATINWDMDLGEAQVTLGGNRTMAAPTNLRVGMIHLRVIQDATGSRTITWNAVFKWASGTAPTLTATATHYDVLTFWCDGTNLYGTASLDVR